MTLRRTAMVQGASSTQWLGRYSPSLCYSQSLKCALCRYCVLFPQKAKRGVQGGFIVRPYVKFKDFHAAAGGHVRTEWWLSHDDTANFLAMIERRRPSVLAQVNELYNRTAEANRKELHSIVDCIVFCGTHDLALRGKEPGTGNFVDLVKFRAEAGDTLLKGHLETASKNATYISPKTQNEIVDICAETLRKEIVARANESYGFSILDIDETTDIAGTEELSLGVWYVDNVLESAMFAKIFLDT